jgi:hypothetical protein
MIEKYFKLGIRFAWVKPTDVGVAFDGTIVDSVRPTSPMTYIGLGGDAIDPSLMMTHVSAFGLTMNMPIQHTWLDFSLGRTARVPMGPYDVLTGFMSGCIIARWQDRGVNYVGHIGTVDNNPDANRKVKRTFAFAMPKGTTGFSPANAWDFNDISSILQKFKGNRPTTNIMALVTTQGHFYSVLMLNTAPNQWYCGGAKLCPPIPHDTLKLRLLHD